MNIAAHILDLARERGIMIATAESCTGNFGSGPNTPMFRDTWCAHSDPSRTLDH